MAIVITGTSITAPDGAIDAADLTGTLPAIDGAALTGVGGGALFSETTSVSVDTTLTDDDAGKVFSATARLTITLPAPSEGFVVAVSASVDHDLLIATDGPSEEISGFVSDTIIGAAKSAILVCDGANWNILGGEGQVTIKVVQFSSSGTYTPPSDVVAFLACAYGSTAGTMSTSNTPKPPTGGAGYSEKFYSSPLSASYPIVIGSNGGGGTAGGTTTVGSISIPSSVAVTSGTTGGAGATGTGGDFNATGGSGNNVTNDNAGGSGGGSATRAGDGGNAGLSGSGVGQTGGGGGTGGNDGAAGVDGGGAGGAAATAEDAGVYSIGSLANPTFQSGGVRSDNNTTGAIGASGLTTYTDPKGDGSYEIGSASSGYGRQSYRRTYSSGIAGARGHVTIVEFYA